MLCATAPVSRLALPLLATSAWAGSVNLVWDADTSPSVAGYTIHYGPASGNYTQALDAGNTTNATVAGLAEGSRYYFAVTAYDATRVESPYSNEVSAVVTAKRVLVPDGTSEQQTFSAYPESRWFAMTVEPGKTYAIEAVDTSGDLSSNAVGSLDILDTDGVSPPPEASVDCAATNALRAPAAAVAADGLRCVLRTAPPSAGLQQNKRAVYLKVTRMDPALGGGSQFRIRAREATIYGRWLTAGYEYHVEVENTTDDAMCVEVTRYGQSGMSYTAGPGWAGSIASFTLAVPALGAAKQVIPGGSAVGGDLEGALRVGACAGPTNFVPAAVHVSTYAFDPATGRLVYFFTSTPNDGRTRNTF